MDKSHDDSGNETKMTIQPLVVKSRLRPSPAAASPEPSNSSPKTMGTVASTSSATTQRKERPRTGRPGQSSQPQPKAARQQHRRKYTSMISLPWWIEHDGQAITSVDVSPCGTRIATSGADKVVRIWSVAPLLSRTYEDHPTYPLLLSELFHDDMVSCIRWSPDGRLLAAACDQSAGIVLWRPCLPHERFLSSGFGTNNAKPTSRRIVDELGEALGGKKKRNSGSMLDQPVPKEEEAQEEQPQLREVWVRCAQLIGHKGDVLDISWSPDGSYLASGSVDNHVIVWDVRSTLASGADAQQLRRLEHTDDDEIFEGVEAIPPLPLVQNVQFALRKRLTGLKTWITGVAWDPLGRYLAAQGLSGEIIIWSVRDNWREVAVIRPPEAEKLHLHAASTSEISYSRLSWSPDGSLLLAPAWSAQRWDYAPLISRDNWSVVKKLVGHSNLSSVAKFSPRLFVKVTPAGDADSGEDSSSRSSNEVLSAPFWLSCVGSRDTAVSVWSDVSNQALAVLSGFFEKTVTDIAWMKDGRTFFVVSHSGELAAIRLCYDDIQDKRIHGTKSTQDESAKSPSESTQTPKSRISVRSYVRPLTAKELLERIHKLYGAESARDFLRNRRMFSDTLAKKLSPALESLTAALPQSVEDLMDIPAPRPAAPLIAPAKPTEAKAIQPPQAQLQPPSQSHLRPFPAPLVGSVETKLAGTDSASFQQTGPVLGGGVMSKADLSAAMAQRITASQIETKTASGKKRITPVSSETAKTLLSDLMTPTAQVAAPSPVPVAPLSQAALSKIMEALPQVVSQQLQKLNLANPSAAVAKPAGAAERSATPLDSIAPTELISKTELQKAVNTALKNFLATRSTALYEIVQDALQQVLIPQTPASGMLPGGITTELPMTYKPLPYIAPLTYTPLLRAALQQRIIVHIKPSSSNTVAASKSGLLSGASTEPGTEPNEAPGRVLGKPVSHSARVLDSASNLGEPPVKRVQSLFKLRVASGDISHRGGEVDSSTAEAGIQSLVPNVLDRVLRYGSLADNLQYQFEAITQAPQEPLKLYQELLTIESRKTCSTVSESPTGPSTPNPPSTPSTNVTEEATAQLEAKLRLQLAQHLQYQNELLVPGASVRVRLRIRYKPSTKLQDMGSTTDALGQTSVTSATPSERLLPLWDDIVSGTCVAAAANRACACICVDESPAAAMQIAKSVAESKVQQQLEQGARLKASSTSVPEEQEKYQAKSQGTKTSGDQSVSSSKTGKSSSSTAAPAATVASAQSTASSTQVPSAQKPPLAVPFETTALHVLYIWDALGRRVCAPIILPEPIHCMDVAPGDIPALVLLTTSARVLVIDLEKGKTVLSACARALIEAAKHIPASVTSGDATGAYQVGIGWNPERSGASTSTFVSSAQLQKTLAQVRLTPNGQPVLTLARGVASYVYDLNLQSWVRVAAPTALLTARDPFLQLMDLRTDTGSMATSAARRAMHEMTHLALTSDGLAGQPPSVAAATATSAAAERAEIVPKLISGRALPTAQHPMRTLQTHAVDYNVSKVLEHRDRLIPPGTPIPSQTPAAAAAKATNIAIIETQLAAALEACSASDVQRFLINYVHELVVRAEIPKTRVAPGGDDLMATSAPTHTLGYLAWAKLTALFHGLLEEAQFDSRTHEARSLAAAKDTSGFTLMDALPDPIMFTRVNLLPLLDLNPSLVSFATAIRSSLAAIAREREQHQDVEFLDQGFDYSYIRDDDALNQSYDQASSVLSGTGRRTSM